MRQKGWWPAVRRSWTCCNIYAARPCARPCLCELAVFWIVRHVATCVCGQDACCRSVSACNAHPRAWHELCRIQRGRHVHVLPLVASSAVVAQHIGGSRIAIPLLRGLPSDGQWQARSSVIGALSNGKSCRRRPVPQSPRCKGLAASGRAHVTAPHCPSCQGGNSRLHVNGTLDGAVSAKHGLHAVLLLQRVPLSFTEPGIRGVLRRGIACIPGYGHSRLTPAKCCVRVRDWLHPAVRIPSSHARKHVLSRPHGCRVCRLQRWRPQACNSRRL